MGTHNKRLHFCNESHMFCITVSTWTVYMFCLKKKKKLKIKLSLVNQKTLYVFDDELFGQNLCPSTGVRMTWGQYADSPRSGDLEVSR